MASYAQLNPDPWRDNDRHRISVTPPASSGIGAALRTSYEVQNLPQDWERLLAKLR